MSTTSTVQEMPVVYLGDLLDAGDGAVVTLLAGETRLAAHRAVLADRSPVFAAMFQHDMLEASSGHVTVTDVEGPVLRQLLSYCYTLQAPHLPDMAPQLLAAADKYCLPALKDACEQQMVAQLAVENAAAAAVLAVRHSCPSLTAAAVAFLRAHIYEVMATQGWVDQVFNHPVSLMEVNRLLADSPTETKEPATAEGGSTPGSHHQPDASLGGQTPATAATPTAPRHTPPPDDAAVSRLRAPATAEGGPTPGSHRQPDASLGRQTPAAAATPTAFRLRFRLTPRPDDADVARFRRLSQQERNRRLVQAAKEGAVREVRALLAAGADAGARDELGRRWTALHYAAERGHEEAARCLVEAGAQVDARSRGQSTPLHLAAQSGHTAVVRLLLAASADPNARDEYGGTPLYWAAVNGGAEAVAALLEGGADRGARDDCGDTPLDMARLNNHHQLIQMLTP